MYSEFLYEKGINLQKSGLVMITGSILFVYSLYNFRIDKSDHDYSCLNDCLIDFFTSSYKTTDLVRRSYLFF